MRNRSHLFQIQFACECFHIRIVHLSDSAKIDSFHLHSIEFNRDSGRDIFSYVCPRFFEPRSVIVAHSLIKGVEPVRYILKKECEVIIKEDILTYTLVLADKSAKRSEQRLYLLGDRLYIYVIFIISGSIILMLLGFALSYFLGEIMGSTALGFLCVAAIVFLLALVVFIMRKKLFTDKMSKMYTKMLLGDERRGIAIPPKGAFSELFAAAFEAKDGGEQP